MALTVCVRPEAPLQPETKGCSTLQSAVAFKLVRGSSAHFVSTRERSLP